MKQIIPVLDEFHGKVIGKLIVNPNRLPKSPNYCFSLGAKVLNENYKNGKRNINKYELVRLAIVDDKNYLKYLQSIKKKGWEI